MGEVPSLERQPNKTFSNVKIFLSFHGTVKYLFLDIFDPAYPDEIDKCTEGIAYMSDGSCGTSTSSSLPSFS